MRAILLLLLRLFPVRFRTQFEAELRCQVESDYDRAQARGRIEALGFALATAWDLLRSAAAEHLNPSWDAGAVGSAKRTHEDHGEGWTMRDWTNDLRQAFRSLARTPGVAMVAVVTLGLAIGANTGIFSVVDAVLLHPLPYRDPGHLVYIAASAPGSDMPPEFGVSPEFYVQYEERAKLLEDAAGYYSFTSTLRVGDRVERVPMVLSTPTLLATLGAQPILGRLPTEDDPDDVVVISYAMWTSWLGSDPNVVGRSYYVSGRMRTVIGVMRPDFWFPNDRTVLWFSQPLHASDIDAGHFGMGLVARTTPRATHPALLSELSELAHRLPRRFGGSANYARILAMHRPVVRPLRAELLGSTPGLLWVLLGSVAIVLLVACANVANLFMVRAERRQLDLAVRRAMGAGRGRLIRTQMAEALVVAGLAAAVAVLVAWIGVPTLVAAAPTDIPRLHQAGIDGPTLLFTVAAAGVAALLCGLGPAIRASAPALAGLRQGARGATRRRHLARNGLVAGQTALALVLLIGSALLVRSWWTLRHVDPGYDTRDVFTFQIAPEGDDLKDGPSFARFDLAFMDRLAALHGVRSVGLVENVPLNEGLASGRFRTESSTDGKDAGTLLDYTWTAGDYFSTMGIPLLRGRSFTREDHLSDTEDVVVSRSAAERLWPGRNPLGRRFRRADMDRWLTVVGVVGDVMQYGFRDKPQALVYFPLAGQGLKGHGPVASPAYVVKTAQADVLAPEVRSLVREVAPGAPMYRVYTMERLAADSMEQLSFTVLTLGIAAVLALILGIVGLYGVLAYVVAGRTREIGVRMALGAPARRVQRMVVAQGGRVVAVGVLLGAAIALSATRVLGSLLFGVAAADATTYAAVSATMLLVGLLASWIPARRASGIDPVRALRGE